MDEGKVFQFIKVILVGFCLLATVLGSVLPYWFMLTVEVSRDAGRTSYFQTLNLGLYYISYGSGMDFTDIVFLSKASNERIVPHLLSVAQVFWLVGNLMIFVAFVMAFLFMCKKYKSVTGEMILAGTLTPAAGCLLLGLVFAALGGMSSNGKTWYSLPLPDFLMLESQPEVSMSFGLYIGAVAVIAAIAAAVMAWMQACVLCRHIEEYRYQMLREPVDDEKFSRGGRAPPAYAKPLRGYGDPDFDNMGEMDL